MSKLQLPLGRLLRDQTPSDTDVGRMWSEVERRVERRRPRVWLALPAVAVLALVCFFALATRRAHRVEGALQIASGDLRALSSPGSERHVALGDGSKIELDATGAIAATGNDEEDLDLVLRGGGARFSVARSSRRWTIDTGVATVQVAAAKFAVWRSSSGVDVEVFEGEVALRGGEVPGGVRKLRSGERLHLAAATAPDRRAPPVAPIPTAPSVERPVALPPPETAKTTAPLDRPRTHSRSVPTPTAPAPTWRALADDKKYDDAYVELGKAGVDAQAKTVDTVDDLLRLSDVARLSGHPREALPALERVVREFPSDPRAGMAAFVRGRIAADDLRDAATAADAFAKAIALGLPDALTETAYYRLVETRTRAGDRSSALEAARRYRAAFPHGRLREAIDGLVETH